MGRYTIAHLAEKSGFKERTIRNFVLHGYLPESDPSEHWELRYGDEHLLRLRAIAKLREKPGYGRNASLKAWFADKTTADVDAFVHGRPAPRGAPARVAAPPPGERWTHVPLVPGLVLLVKDDATPLVARLASEIRATYGTK